jgi:hypothetical protein
MEGASVSRDLVTHFDRFSPVFVIIGRISYTIQAVYCPVSPLDGVSCLRQTFESFHFSTCVLILTFFPPHFREHLYGELLHVQSAFFAGIVQSFHVS